MRRNIFRAIKAKFFNFFMNNDENMRNFNPNVRSQKYVILSNFTSVAKWGGTLLLSIWCTYNWYLLEVYGLGNMLHTVIGVWKCVKNFLESWKGNIFKFFSWNLMKKWGISIWISDPKNMRFHEKIWNFFLSTTLKNFLRAFRHLWWYLTCSLDHKLQVDTSYMYIKWIEEAYRPTSPH